MLYTSKLQSSAIFLIYVSIKACLIEVSNKMSL